MFYTLYPHPAQCISEGASSKAGGWAQVLGRPPSQEILLHHCNQRVPWPSSGREGNDIPTQKGNSEVLAEDGVEDEALESTREQLGMPDTEATQQPCTFLLSPGWKQRWVVCHEQKGDLRGLHFYLF